MLQKKKISSWQSVAHSGRKCTCPSVQEQSDSHYLQVCDFYPLKEYLLLSLPIQEQRVLTLHDCENAIRVSFVHTHIRAADTGSYCRCNSFCEVWLLKKASPISRRRVKEDLHRCSLNECCCMFKWSSCIEFDLWICHRDIHTSVTSALS